VVELRRANGQDARSERGFGNRIKVESKHYARASLDLRELTAEIVQAAMLGPEMDMCALAATCPISDQHAVSGKTSADLRYSELLPVKGRTPYPHIRDGSMANTIESFPEKTL